MIELEYLKIFFARANKVAANGTSEQFIGSIIKLGSYVHTKQNVILAALREKAERENPQPLTEYQFEKICESVHNGWWEEKKTQGITNHPDMIPYSELAESVKDYDRVTVRRVLDALGIVYGNPPKEVQS